MKGVEVDPLKMVFRPYFITVLKLLKNGPKQFKELRAVVKNGRTLSLKLAQLINYGLVETIGIKKDGKYINCYKISTKGIRLLGALDELFKKN